MQTIPCLYEYNSWLKYKKSQDHKDLKILGCNRKKECPEGYKKVEKNFCVAKKTQNQTQDSNPVIPSTVRTGANGSFEVFSTLFFFVFVALVIFSQIKMFF